jgi:hypothetical protein
MKADYLTLTNGRKVRIEWNWNAVNEWGNATGKELTDLAKGKAKAADMLAIVYQAAVEGERIDGTELGLTEKDFGGLINMQGIIVASNIITAQSSTLAQKKSEAPNRLLKIFFRKKV